ncbi:hypothetical protein PVIIG_01715 [Plasmodium vivax India VII]|uniref:AP2/ERF domain-containing protein n=1 Tax=Plasmodium vivax India VII TaxID=1077284 RepID=A0A0J9S956_PLAVI|nr:hypothetical protein PVIIG_01715 [Plasmodium vivax India VII]
MSHPGVANRAGLNPNGGNFYTAMYSGGIPPKEESQKGYVGEDKNWSSKGGGPLTPIGKNLNGVIFYQNEIPIDRMKSATPGGAFTPNGSEQYGEADNLMIHQSCINHVQQDGLVGDKDEEICTLLPGDNNRCDRLTSMLGNVPEGYIQNVPINYQVGWTCSNEWGGSQTQGVAPSGNNPNARRNGISHLNSSTTPLPNNRCAGPNYPFDKSGGDNHGDLPSDVHLNNHPTSSLVYHPDGYPIGSKTNSIYLNRDVLKLPVSEDAHVIPQKGYPTSSGNYHVSGEETNQMDPPNCTKAMFTYQWSNEELLSKQANMPSYRIRRKGDNTHEGESYEMRSSEYEPIGQPHLQQGQPNFASSEGYVYPSGFQAQTQLNPSGAPLINTCGSFPVGSAIREDDSVTAHVGSSRDGQSLNRRQGTVPFEEQLADYAGAQVDSTESTMHNPLTLPLNRDVHANNSTAVASDNLVGNSYAPFVDNQMQNCQPLGEGKFFPINGNYCVSSLGGAYPFDGNQMGDTTGFMKLYNNGNTYGEDTEVSAWPTLGSYPPKEVLNSATSNAKESHSSLIGSSGDGGASPHLCSFPHMCNSPGESNFTGVSNFPGACDLPQRGLSSSSRQLSLLDEPNGVSNEQEEALQRQRMYDLYVQSLLSEAGGLVNPGGVIAPGGVATPKTHPGEKNDQLILFNLKNMRNKIAKKAPQMASNYLSYLDHYIASLRLLYKKLLSNRKLIFILAKEVFAPPKKRDKKAYADDKASPFETKHSYVQELLAALLPQPPVFPPFEIWICMGKKNASQLHKLHLTIYIIYQKIICNISNILLKINKDMVSYANKNKLSKRSGTDSLNDYVNDHGEGVKRADCPVLSATRGEAPVGGLPSGECVAKRGVHDREVASAVEDAVEAVDGVDAGESVDAVAPVDSVDAADEPNPHRGDIPRRCLFRIDQKLAIMMASIDNISKMMNLAKGEGSNGSSGPSVDPPDEEGKSIDETPKEVGDVGEDGDNTQQDDERGLEKEGEMVKHTQNASEGISPSGCQPRPISISPKDGQIVAYDEPTCNDGRPLFEKMAKFKLDYSNSMGKESPVKLLNELKYELRNVYNEIRALKRHDSYCLSRRDSGEAGGSLELVNPNDDHGDDYAVPSDRSAVSNVKVKAADETCLLNDLLYNRSESPNPLVNAHTEDYHPCASKKKGKKINQRQQTDLLNSLINSNICSNEQVNNDVVYDLKYTDDIFKKLLFLCQNFYTNLSEYKEYALGSLHENEVDLTNLGELHNFRYLNSQAFFANRPLLPSGELPPEEDFPAGKYQLEEGAPPLCSENGDVGLHTIEQVNGLPVEAEDHPSNVPPVVGSSGGDDGEETHLSDDQVGSTNCANGATNAHGANCTHLRGVFPYDAPESSTPYSQHYFRGRIPPWVELPMEKKEDKEGAHQVDAFFAKFYGQEELTEAYGETPRSAILQMGQMDNYLAAACTGGSEGVRYSPFFLKAANGDYARGEVGLGNGPSETLLISTQNGPHHSYPIQHRGDAYGAIRNALLIDTPHANSEESYVNNSYVQNDVETAKNCNYLLSNVQNVYYPTGENLPLTFESTEGLVRSDCRKCEASVPHPYAANTNGNMRSDDAFLGFSTPMMRCLNADGGYSGGEVMGNCLHMPHAPYHKTYHKTYHKNQPLGMFNCGGANGFAATDADSPNHIAMNRNVAYYTDGSALPGMFNSQGVQNILQKGSYKDELRSDQFASNVGTNHIMRASDAGMTNQFSYNNEQTMNVRRADDMPHCTSNYRSAGERNTFNDALYEGENFTEKIYTQNGNYFNNNELRDTTEDVSDNEMNSGGGNDNLGDDENTVDEGSSCYVKNGLTTNDAADHLKLPSNVAKGVSGVKSESWNGEEMGKCLLKGGEVEKYLLKGEQMETCPLTGEQMKKCPLTGEQMETCPLTGEELMRHDGPPEGDPPPESPNDCPNMTIERKDPNQMNNANKRKLKKMLEVTDKLIGKKYRGISYDPTRNGWSTFVYKDGVRRKKFFSSYKYGNLLAKKKSIEWRLKNLNPDSNAYVFSLKAKEEFNAILDDGYADIKSINCDGRGGRNNGDRANNRDILYVNAFINLFSSSAGVEKDEPGEPNEQKETKEPDEQNERKEPDETKETKETKETNEASEPLCQMDKSSHEKHAEACTTKGAQGGSGPGSSELGEANDKVGGAHGGDIGGNNVGSDDAHLTDRSYPCDNRTPSNVGREPPCASEDKEEGIKRNCQGNDSMVECTHLSSHSIDQADGCLPPNGDLLVYKNYCSRLLNGEEAPRSEPGGRKEGSGQNTNVGNLNDAAEEEAKRAQGDIPDQTAPRQIVNGPNGELTIFPHSNDVPPLHCAVLPGEGLDPRLPSGDNFVVTRCGNRKKRKRHIIKSEGKNPFGEGGPDVTGTGDPFSSAYSARDAAAGGCSDSGSGSSELCGSDTRSCDGRSGGLSGGRIGDQRDGQQGDQRGDGNEEQSKRWMDSTPIHSVEGSHPSLGEEESTCRNHTAREDDSKEALQYAKEGTAKNEHLKQFNCGSGGNNQGSGDTVYNNAGFYPDGNCLTSGQPLLNGVAPTSEVSIVRTFYPGGCESIPQEQLTDGVVNRAKDLHMGREEENNLRYGDVTRLDELSHEMERQVGFLSEEAEGRSPNGVQQWDANNAQQWAANESQQCTANESQQCTANESQECTANGSKQWTPNRVAEAGTSPRERDLLLENKHTSDKDKNCFLYKDTLLRYMNECTCTGEEERSVFLQFLRLTPEWVLLELDELEEVYHAYFRNKIESFYKAYLVKIGSQSNRSSQSSQSGQSSSHLREVPEKGSCRSASGFPTKRSEYIRELQLIFDKKLSTLWTCMIFPIDFLYILNYRIFRILKSMSKKKVRSSKREEDKEFQCVLKGVSFIKYKSAWCFTYADLDGRKKEKVFPINHYGFKEAKMLSILYRRSFVLHLTKMYTFVKNVLLKSNAQSGGTIKRLINPKSINHFIDYYKKYEEFLVCYGKIVYFNESKNVFLTTGKKRDPLNYLPFEIRRKISGEMDPLNLITATRNYFSKKSQLVKFPKGVVYLSGYFLWVLLFLNHNNKEVVISFSARKYSFETAKDRCFQCYYCLLHTYKFRPINMSGIVDLILETDLESKNYNLLDYEGEEMMPLDCLFHFFAPSNYVLQNGVIYKRLLHNQPHLEGHLRGEKYDSLFPSEYVSLDDFQTYQIEEDYFVEASEGGGPRSGCMESEGGVDTQGNLLNEAGVATQEQYSPRQHQPDRHPCHPVEHSEGGECQTKKHRRSSDDLLLYQEMEQTKKDIPLYFTDDENGKSMRLQRRDSCRGRSFKRGNCTNLGGPPEEGDVAPWEEHHLHSDSDGSCGSCGSCGSSGSSGSSGADEEAARERGWEKKKKTHGVRHPSRQQNEDFTMCRSEREGMPSWGDHPTVDVANQRGDHPTVDVANRRGDHPTVDAANRREPNGQVSWDTIDRRNGEESTHENEKDNFINNAENYQNVWNKNIFHFFDNNMQDDYLKRNYDALFNKKEEKNVVFKKISEKEEHVGVFIMLNCQWLSDSFVHNINQIETKYADIYSFKNYVNTREEVLNWKYEKNFIKDCADIAKKCPRIVGVHYDTHAHAWVANRTSNGKRRDKKFLVKTFGFLQARKMAIAHREKWQQQQREKNINETGDSRVDTCQMEESEQ